MQRTFIMIILLVLCSNFCIIGYTLFLDFVDLRIDIIAILLYLCVLAFIATIIYFILSKNAKTPFYLSCYFILCLITTVAEIIYLSANDLGTKDKMTYFLVYFVLFVYATKSHYLRDYFKSRLQPNPPTMVDGASEGLSNTKQLDAQS